MKRIILNTVRTAAALLSAAFLILFIVPMAGGIVNIGNIAGSLLCVWLFCMSVKPVHRFLKKALCRFFLSRMLYRIVNFCFAAFAIYGAVVTCAMVYCAAQAPAESSTAVVLGAKVKSSGPSVMLQGRINAADEYLEENPEAYAVLTGGQGDDEPMSEAQSMYDALCGEGIDAERLYKEESSVNTTENLEYSMQIIEENNLNGDIAVVTDGFHQLRVRIIAKQLGIKGNVGAVNSDTSLKYLPTFAVREWFALPYQVLFR